MLQLRSVCFLVVPLLSIACGGAEAPTGDADAGDTAGSPVLTAVPYGANEEASATLTHDGVQLYYETYGQGEPLLLIHGNGGSIGTLAAQIEHFRSRYHVIAMDSRDQGRSGDSPDQLTYEKMTDDLAALLEHLGVGPANVLGWSDGAIEALLLGIRHPDKVKKLASMAANLNPTEAALYGETLDLIQGFIDAMPEEERDTPAGRRALKPTMMMLEQPQIPVTQLASITAPTLIMAGDHDVIRGSHTLEIFESIPNAQLAIFPGATHMVPYDDPELFNSTVERFFKSDAREIDRIADTMASFEKIMASLPH